MGTNDLLDHSLQYCSVYLLHCLKDAHEAKVRCPPDISLEEVSYYDCLLMFARESMLFLGRLPTEISNNELYWHRYFLGCCSELDPCFGCILPSLLWKCTVPSQPTDSLCNWMLTVYKCVECGERNLCSAWSFVHSHTCAHLGSLQRADVADWLAVSKSPKNWMKWTPLCRHLKWVFHFLFNK